MANYLARVGASGAASRSNARPAVVAPPILPGRGGSIDPELSASGNLSNRSSLIPIAQSPGRNAPLDPTVPSSTPVTDTGPSMMQGDQDPQISQTPSPRIEPATLPPPVRLQSMSGNVIRAPRPLVKSDGVGAQSSKPFPLTPSPDAVIHAPKAFSDANAPRRFSSGQVPGEAVGVQRPEPVVTPATAIDIDLATQKTARRDPQPIEQRLVEPVLRRSGERFETPQIPVSNAAFDLPSSRHCSTRAEDHDRANRRSGDQHACANPGSCRRRERR